MFTPRHQNDDGDITGIKEIRKKTLKAKIPRKSKNDVRTVHSSYTASWRDMVHGIWTQRTSTETLQVITVAV